MNSAFTLKLLTPENMKKNVPLKTRKVASAALSVIVTVGYVKTTKSRIRQNWINSGKTIGISIN